MTSDEAFLPKRLFAAVFAALLAGGCASTAETDWRSEMWKRPVTLRRGVTIRAYALDKPRMMKAYVVRVDLAVPGLGFTATERAANWGETMPDYTNGTWIVDTKRETVADFLTRRRKEGRNVEIAVNASGWGPWSGAACDTAYATLHRWALSDGTVVSHGKKPRGGIYFTVGKDGAAAIRRISAYAVKDLSIALYSTRHILQDGRPTPETENHHEVHPRTAFGVTADGKTLVLLVVDGRQPGYSEGATRLDLAEMLLREGCADGVNMDGGGSSSLVLWDGKSGRPTMVNRHADGYVRRTAMNLGITFDGTERKDSL